ncbi:hypothetical protein P5673_015406 [Acropora cervicornis]|uniref:Uncharacterized protein n=1 Tax=Acropora cervicornis TaxID=6130 RepID=A0AAD9QIB3_ACRCE|nr:hypothetical protein P5673_015406 [Acropora cervicornis]
MTLCLFQTALLYHYSKEVSSNSLSFTTESSPTCRESYTKQVDFYSLANQVLNAKTKKAILWMNLPLETYQLAAAHLRDDAITYDVIMQRTNSSESVGHYVATLKHLAMECKFEEAM